jgi:hypothetical protein
MAEREMETTKGLRSDEWHDQQKSQAPSEDEEMAFETCFFGKI